MDNTLLVNFFRYHLWANLRILDACASLDDTVLDTSTPGTFGSIRETLVHLFAAEEGYVNILSDQQITQRLREGAAFPDFDELRRHAQQSGERLIALVEHFDASRVVRLRYDEVFYDVPAYLVLIQALNHATDHLSQITTALSQQGIALPELNTWDYYHERIRPQ